MSPESKGMAAKLAARIHKDPTSATVDDVRKLVRIVLMLTTGKVP